MIILHQRSCLFDEININLKLSESFYKKIAMKRNMERFLSLDLHQRSCLFDEINSNLKLSESFYKKMAMKRNMERFLSLDLRTQNMGSCLKTILFAGWETKFVWHLKISIDLQCSAPPLYLFIPWFPSSNNPRTVQKPASQQFLDE